MQNTEKWRKAIDKKEAITPPGVVTSEPKKDGLEEEIAFEKQREIDQAIEKLGIFVSSPDGAVAKELFRKSGQHYTFCIDFDDGRGIGHAYIMDGNGIQSCDEQIGLGAAFGTIKVDRQTTPSSAEVAIRAAVLQGANPMEILPQLILRLDEIAEAILEPA